MIATAQRPIRGETGAGYSSAEYARALSDFGRPLRLAHAGGWVIERPVPGRDLRDAMGPYPLFSCARWEGLGKDLAALEGTLVSLLLVTDPFGGYDEHLLGGLFPDLLRRYKSHFVIDLNRPLLTDLPSHHRRNMRRGLRGVTVELCAPPLRFADEWTALYAGLIERRGIRGMAAFSRESFLRQFEVPGLVALRAREGEATVAMQLWIREGRQAYYHLGASSERGYALRAAYALMHGAVHHFADAGCERLDLGAGAGADPRRDDGLVRFKRGWSTGSLPVYLCGRILDRTAYARITRHSRTSRPDYFPLYRSGEFD